MCFTILPPLNSFRIWCFLEVPERPVGQTPGLVEDKPASIVRLEA
jgi:hypothetical protein